MLALREDTVLPARAASPLAALDTPQPRFCLTSDRSGTPVFVVAESQQALLEQTAHISHGGVPTWGAVQRRADGRLELCTRQRRPTFLYELVDWAARNAHLPRIERLFRACVTVRGADGMVRSRQHDDSLWAGL